MEAAEHSFDVAYVFTTGARGRDKQAFAVAKHFAPEVREVDRFDESLVGRIKQTGNALLVSTGGGEQTHLAAYTKMHCGDKAFAIQLMDPNEGYSLFDIIVSPIFEKKEHFKNDSNVLHLMCMPSRGKRDVMDTNLIGWKNWIPRLGENPTLVMVGGSSQFVSITEDNFRETCHIICQRTLYLSAGGEQRKLFFVTSPRTNHGFIDIIREVTMEYGVHRAISDFNKYRGKDDVVNASLRFINDVVVTGDSMSMISEAVFYGRSVTIADNGAFGASRYSPLHKEFYDKSLAQPLTSKSLVMEEHMRGPTPNPLLEIEARVSEVLAARKAAATIPR